MQVGVFYVPRLSSIAWIEERHLPAFLVVCGPCAPHVSRNYSVQACRVFTNCIETVLIIFDKVFFVCSSAVLNGLYF